jgi:hypothetical protein
MSFDSYNESIEIYKDYTYIMYILCDKTASFYSKIKNIINIPIVVCSTALSILNTADFISHTDMISIIRNISIACNLLIAITIAILNLFKIPEKEYSFKTHSDNFLQLHNKITTEIAKSKTIHTKVDILRIIDEYNLYCEKISFHIPTRIRKHIIKDYNNYKLPLLLINNNRKNNKKYIKMAYFFNMFKKLPKSPSTTTSTSYTTTHEVYNISRSSSLSSINIIHDDYIPKPYHNVLSPIQSLNGSPFSVFDMRNSPVRQLQMSPLAIVPMHKVYMTNKAFSKTHVQPFDKDLMKKPKRSRSS